MDDKVVNIGKWQKRLENTFNDFNGNLGIYSQRLLKAEESHKVENVNKSKGFTVLMDSFMDFALMTIDEIQNHKYTINVHNFSFNATAIQRLRSALKLFCEGYYFEAATHLRTVFEITSYLCCVLHGEFWFDELFTPMNDIAPENTSFETLIKKLRNHSNKIAKQARQKTVGNNSGLNSQHREAINEMFMILNQHIHYGTSSVIEYVLYMCKNHNLPRLEPKFDMRRACIFCNTTVSVSWSLLRVLPWLSLPNRYSNEWQHKYQVLDESFEFYIKSWEMPAGPAVFDLIKQNFTFDNDIASNQVLKTTPINF